MWHMLRIGAALFRSRPFTYRGATSAPAWIVRNASGSSKVKREYTKAEDDTIIQRRREGAAWKDVATELKRGQKSVVARSYRHLFKGDVRKQLEHESIFTPERQQTIIELKKAGASWAEIGASAGLTLRQAESHWGTVLNGPSPISFGRRAPNLTSSEVERLVDLRERQMLKWKAIAQMMKRSNMTLWKAYRRMKPELKTTIASRFKLYLPAEDQQLAHLKEVEGLTWPAISMLMPRRSLSSLATRYNRTVKHRGTGLESKQPS